MSRAKDEKIVDESQKVFSAIKILGIILAVLIFVFLITKENKPTPKQKIYTGKVSSTTSMWHTFQWKKRLGHTGMTSQNRGAYPAEVEKTNISLNFTYYYNNRTGVFETTNNMSGYFEGTWKCPDGWGVWETTSVSPGLIKGRFIYGEDWPADRENDPRVIDFTVKPNSS